MLHKTVASLIEILGGLADWAYAVLFLAAVLETIPGVGLLIPGQVIVIAGGAAASLGYIDVGDVIVFATLGAVLGDTFAFWLGRRGGRGLLLRWGTRFGLRPEHFDKSRAVLDRNPFVAIVLGRFNNLTRAFVPYAAGTVGFPAGRFLAFNVVGGLLWAAVSTLVGVAFGRSYKLAEALLGRFLGVLFVLLVLSYVSYRLLLLAHAAITAPEAAWFVGAVVATAGFLLVAEDVEDRDGLVAYDGPAAESAARIAATPALTLLALVSDFGSAAVVAPLVALAVAVLWRAGRRRDAVAIGILVLSTQAVVFALKELFARPRPGTTAGLAAGYSFPSGHTTTAALLACAVAWLAYRHVRVRYLPAVTLWAALGWVFAMALSRLALGVHFFTDVVGGALLGFAIGGFGLAGPAILPRLREAALSSIDRVVLLRRRPG